MIPSPNPSLQGTVGPGNPSPVEGLSKESSQGSAFELLLSAGLSGAVSSLPLPQRCPSTVYKVLPAVLSLRESSGGCHQRGTWQKSSPDGVQVSRLSHSGMWLCRHCWCCSALCPLPKGHSDFPTSCFPTILNAEVHFIRSGMPSSCTHLKCR